MAPEEDKDRMDSDDIIEEITNNMKLEPLFSNHKNDVYLESLQAIANDPQNKNAENIETLHKALSSALSFHKSFMDSAVEKCKSDHAKHVELQRKVKSLESENIECKGKHEKMEERLSETKKNEKMILSEVHEMLSEFAVEHKMSPIQETQPKPAFKRAKSVHLNNLKTDLHHKKSRIELLQFQLKSQEEQFDNEYNILSEELKKCKKELLEAEISNADLLDREKQNKLDLDTAISDCEDMRKTYGNLEQKVVEERTEREAVTAQMLAMEKDHSRVKAELTQAHEISEAKLKERLMEQEEKCKMLEKQIDNLEVEKAGLEVEIKVLNNSPKDSFFGGGQEQQTQMLKMSKQMGQSVKKLEIEGRRIQEAEDRIKELESELREGQAERRKMHNIIQDLRGNVRVFARIRPFLSGDNVGDDASPCVVPKNENELKLRMGEDEPWQHKFSFDKVFPPSAGQEAVFEDASEFIQSALDGYNVCLFSYGQTGSGKTHTMQGSGLGQMRGIIPRSLEQVGKCKLKLEQDGWSYEIKVSYLEIYNETIRDLLRKNASEEVKHDIKLNKDGTRFVSSLTMMELDPNDSEAIEKVMEQAAKHRSVASTDMNAVSSRSHAVFTLHLKAKHSEQKQSLRGELNLVDLAGSERIKKSNVTGDQAKEATSINKSLSSLTDVFVAIGRKGAHIPYRNSKLTYLLQPCIGGEGKTLMVVNLSPTDASSFESLSALRFASMVNKCELGKATRSIKDYKDDEPADSLAAPKKSRSSEPSRTTKTTKSRSPVPSRSTTPVPSGTTTSRTRSPLPSRTTTPRTTIPAPSRTHSPGGTRIPLASRTATSSKPQSATASKTTTSSKLRRPKTSKLRSIRNIRGNLAKRMSIRHKK